MEAKGGQNIERGRRHPKRKLNTPEKNLACYHFTKDEPKSYWINIIVLYSSGVIV